MNNFIYQLKQAWAGLSAKKGFLVTVVTTLGITLGALLCILTLAYVVIAKPLPYPEQDSLYQLDLVDFNGKGERSGNAYNYPSLVHLFDNQTAFAEFALVEYGEGILSSQPSQPNVRTTFVTPDWFTLLGSKMVLGRIFEQTEEKDSYNPVAILSHETWQNEFNGDNSILEQTITFNNINFRIVGVLAEEFIEPQLYGIGLKTDVFLPWDYNNTSPRMRQSWGRVTDARRFVGKLDSQLSTTQIEQSLTTLVNSTWLENVAEMAFFDGWKIEMELKTFKSSILGDSKNTVLLLLAGVIGLVLVACTNITNLFMSRTAEQQRELAIQAAVGASRSHLFKSLFAQSGLVVFISVLVALIIASVGFWVLQHYLALRLPRVDELAINSVTLGSALIIALLLAIFFARLSANMINYRALNTALQSSGKGTGIQVSKKVRRWLIISQVAIVTLLVFVNMGLLRDSLKVINQPLGFEIENIASLTVDVGSELTEEETESLMGELKSKLMALPQMENVSQGVSDLGLFFNQAQTPEVTQERLLVETRNVGDLNFQMIGQPLIEGDYFSAADLKEQNRLIIVNDVYAAKLAPEGSALGSKINYRNALYTVTGVVKGVLMPTATEIPMRSYPVTSLDDNWFMLKLKPRQTLSREQVVTTLQGISGQLGLSKLETLDEQRDRLLFAQYTTAITSAVLAILTFLLAAIGLYGILNYATQMRRFELGTRMAIGAKGMDVLNLIIKDNAGAVGVGIVISLIASLALYLGFSEALASYINSQLVVLFFVTVAVICIMALFACYWPLRSTIKSPPIHSLRGVE